MGLNFGAVWTDEQDNVLRRLARAGGTIRDVLSAMPERTEKAVRHRARILHVSLRRKRTWTAAEDDVVSSVVPRYGARAAAQRLTHRSLGSIRRRAHRLGVRYRHAWTEGDRALVAAIYPSTGTARIAPAVGVSKRAIYRVAREVGVSFERSGVSP